MDSKEQLIKREERYIVVKLKHLEDVSVAALREYLQEWQIPTQECVVVESDWPNYEMVWKSIQRVSDTTYSDPYAEIEQLTVALKKVSDYSLRLESEIEQLRKEREWIDTYIFTPHADFEVVCCYLDDVFLATYRENQGYGWFENKTGDVVEVTRWKEKPEAYQPPKDNNNDIG